MRRGVASIINTLEDRGCSQKLFLSNASCIFNFISKKLKDIPAKSLSRGSIWMQHFTFSLAFFINEVTFFKKYIIEQTRLEMTYTVHETTLPFTCIF